MIKLTLKALALVMVFALAGCGEPADDAMDPFDPTVEVETDLSDEALIDIMAYSSYYSMELQEAYQEDPEAATQEFQERMEDISAQHGVTLEDLQMDMAYEHQWNNIMSDPEMQQIFQERILELQE